MSPDDEKDEIHHDWQKIERTATKAGLRDGFSDGRESNFQKSFDEGFIQGFNNGFAIGQYSGALFILQKDSNETLIRDNLLENPRRGWCDLCKNPQTTPKTQTETVNENISKIHSKYGSEILKSFKLPEQLD